MPHYQVISLGVQAECDPKQAILALSRVFKKTPKELLPLVNKIWVIKKTDDLALAKKYQRRLEQAGLNCQITLIAPLTPAPLVIPHTSRSTTQSKSTAPVKAKPLAKLSLLMLLLAVLFWLYQPLWQTEQGFLLSPTATFSPAFRSLETEENSSQARITQNLKLPKLQTNVFPQLSAVEQAGLREKIHNALTLTQVTFERKRATSVIDKPQSQQWWLAGDFEPLEDLGNRYLQQQNNLDGEHPLATLHQQLSWQQLQSLQTWEAYEATSQQWLKQVSHSILAPVILAQAYHDRAWQIRGTTPSESVAADKWRGFYHYIDKSLHTLKHYKVQANVNPEWHVLLLAIARPLKWSKQSILEQYKVALRSMPYYVRLHQIAADNFRPEWGGSFSEIEQIALLAVDKTQQREGWAMYARLYATLANAHYREHIFAAAAYQPEQLRQAVLDLLARYPSDKQQNRMIQLSCWANDKALNMYLLRQTDTTPSVIAWDAYADYYHCYDVSLALLR